MRKLAFITLFGLGSFAAIAQVTDPTQQTTDPTQSQTTDPTQQTVDPAQQQTVDPAQQMAEKETPVRDADGYGEIKKRELPDGIKKSIKEDYPKSKIRKVSSNEAGQYKLEVELQEGTTETMIVDEEGNPMEQ